jgi:hypothetical protein
MTNSISSLSESVKDGIVDAVKRTEDAPGAMIEAVSKTVARTVQGVDGVTMSVMDVTSQVAHGTIEAVTEVDGDLGQAARGLVVGVVRGARQSGVVNLVTIGRTSESVIRTAARLSGDVGAAARGLIEGAIQSAREIGLDSAAAGTAAVIGAMKAAGQIGSVAGDRVRHSLVHAIARVDDVLNEPLSTCKSSRIPTA